MPKITPKQEHKKILRELYKEGKTFKQLQKTLKYSEKDLKELLGDLENLNFIELKGNKYFIKEFILETVKRKKESLEKPREKEFKIGIRAVIEIKGINEKEIEKNAKKIKEALEETNAFRMRKFYLEKPEELEDGTFSGFVDFELDGKNLENIVYFLFYYTPVVVEVLYPERLDLSIGELQDALLVINDVFSAYTEYLKTSVIKEELLKKRKKPR